MRIVRSSSLAMAGATLAFALSVTTMTASAASTFLLQFGTHKTETEARTQWDELQSQYPDLLGGMNVRIAPVNEEFRTQASGVISRDSAQQTCNRLAADKVECLVVETSMYAPDTSSQDANFAPIAPVEENISVEMVSDEMQSVTVEDNALTPQPEVAAVEPVTAPKEKSFREALLPWIGFGDKEEPAQPETKATQTTAVTPVQAEPLRPQRIDAAPLPAAQERAIATSLSANLPPQPAAPARPVLQPGETRVVASRAPRPLQAPQTDAQQQFAEAVTPQEAPITPEPQAVQGHGEVEIAEAIQVPLSFGDAAPVPANKPVGYGGFPSQPLTERALWVQMSNFANKESAMNYWRQISAQNPEMMRLLRVRIVAPLRASGLKQTASLRMGPFTDRNEINRICGIAAQSKLRCTMVQEVGSSTTANVVRTPGNVEGHNLRMATSRNYSRNAGTPPSGMFWIQLGAFPSVAEAQQRWDALKTTHNDVLGRMQPQISYPALSSSPTPVYHLRTGPFVSKSSAIDNCNSLQNRHVGCVIVQSR